MPPREAAKSLIRAYVERGDNPEWLRKGHLGAWTKDYGASIGGYLNGKSVPNTKIIVTRVGETEVNEVFDFYEIFEEIKCGSSQGTLF